MKWKEMSLSYKIAAVIFGLAIVAWLVSKVKPDLFPFDLTYPAISVVTACESVVYWSKKRKWSYILIAGAVISLACFILELALKS